MINRPHIVRNIVEKAVNENLASESDISNIYYQLANLEDEVFEDIADGRLKYSFGIIPSDKNKHLSMFLIPNE